MYMVWCKLGEGCWGCIGIIHKGELELEHSIIIFSICSAEKGQRVVRARLVISACSGEVVVSWKGFLGFELRNEHWWMGCQKVTADGSIWCVVIIASKGADSVLLKGWFVSIICDDGVGEGILRIRTPLVSVVYCYAPLGEALNVLLIQLSHRSVLQGDT